MSIKFNPSTIKSATNYSKKDLPSSRKILKGLSDNGLARFVLLEACVEAGRTYQAYKRGGKDEARERFAEEFVGAVFWLKGIDIYNSLIDQIGKKVLKLKDVDFDITSDNVRNPLKNFVNENSKNRKTSLKDFEQKIKNFKTAKIIASVLLANATIGFIVPKINQAITRACHKKSGNSNANEDKFVKQSTLTPNIESFMNSKDKKKNLSFGQLTFFDIANNLETDQTWKLLSSDCGIAGGRAISARNKDERLEILFRDIGSIFFYMWSMPLINKAFNMIEQNGKNSRLDSVNASYINDTIISQMKNANINSISANDLEKFVFGEGKNIDINKYFTKEVIEIDEFLKNLPEILKKEHISEDAIYKELAKQFTKLQPELAGKSIITIDQAQKIFKGGMINNPEFLKNLYELSHGKDKSGIANIINPRRFIDQKSLKNVDEDAKYFVEQMIQNAKKSGKDITIEMIEKAKKTNFRMNLLNWGTGFIVSSMFLSTIIPKIQYWITRKRTGSDEFPGTKEFRK